MAQEIERKYLVDVARWRPAGQGARLVQGYLSSRKECVVRVRIEDAVARLTVKGEATGISRAEFEYPIPVADAEVMLATLCQRPLIEKQRHREVHNGKVWEIDVFAGENRGLVLAEVELASEHEVVDVPPWATQEVSHDARYYNSSLIARPFSSW
ncbi:MAG: CYTH domain-containing protein [Deltaproteobacteria bacterium]|nr:CYTH domain-containing protein [Deltaproteobacteria bacterium]